MEKVIVAAAISSFISMLLFLLGFILKIIFSLRKDFDAHFHRSNGSVRVERVKGWKNGNGKLPESVSHE